MAHGAPDWTREVVISVVFPPTVLLPEVPVAPSGRYSGTSTSDQTVCSWTVSSAKTGVLREVSMVSSEPSHAQYTLTIGGTALFTAQKFQNPLTLVFPDLRLAAGTVIALKVKSDDGTSIVVDGEISGKEVG